MYENPTTLFAGIDARTAGTPSSRCASAEQFYALKMLSFLYGENRKKKTERKRGGGCRVDVYAQARFVLAQASPPPTHPPTHLPEWPAKGVLNREPIRYRVMKLVSFCSSSTPVSGSTNTPMSTCVI